MLNWWTFLAANSYRLSVPTIYVQIQFPFMNSFSRIIFMNSLSPIFFYKFNITNSFSRINLRIHKSSYEFARLRFGSFLQNQCYVANGLYCTGAICSWFSVLSLFVDCLGSCDALIVLLMNFFGNHRLTLQKSSFYIGWVNPPFPCGHNRKNKA